jgi:hypothetical protein
VRAAPAVVALAVGVLGCTGPETRPGWLDRPWIDSGCDAAGWCRLRGRLEMPRDDGSTRGRLWLDDGTCLSLDLTGQYIRTAGDWDGRRVAVRGRLAPAEATAVAGPEACAATGVLYADRLSLKVAR